jgi:hypothetical protein
MRATTVELPSSHLSMLSHPREITDLVPEAAVQNAQSKPDFRLAAANFHARPRATLKSPRCKPI